MEIITIVASLIFSLTLYRWFYLKKKKKKKEKRQQSQQVYLDLKDEKYYLDAISQDYIDAMAKYKK